MSYKKNQFHSAFPHSLEGYAATIVETCSRLRYICSKWKLSTLLKAISHSRLIFFLSFIHILHQTKLQMLFQNFPHKIL